MSLCLSGYSVVFSCSHAGHSAMLYVAPAGSRHVPFIILRICPGSSSTWMNVAYTSSQRAQSPWSSASRPGHPGGVPACFSIPDRAVGVHCEWPGAVTHSDSVCVHVPFAAMCLSQCRPQGTVSVHTSVPSSPRDYPYQSLNRIPDTSLPVPLSHQ